MNESCLNAHPIVESSIVSIDLGLVFMGAVKFNADISTWQTSKVTTMKKSTFATTTSSNSTMHCPLKKLFLLLIVLDLVVFTH